MTDDTKTPHEIRGCCNLEGVMHAAAIALLHTDKLENDQQRADLIAAALDIVRTICVDDLTHTIGIGRVPDEVIVARLTELGAQTEDIRQRRLDRFFNLCELLKPHLDLSYRVEHRDAA